MPWTIGAWNCPRLSEVVQLCPVAYGLDSCPDHGRAGHMAGVARCLWYALDAVQLTPGPSLGLIDAGRVYALDIATGRAWTKEKPPDVSEGVLLFVGCMIGRGGFIAWYVSHYVRGFTMQGVA